MSLTKDDFTSTETIDQIKIGDTMVYVKLFILFISCKYVILDIMIP